MSFLEPLPPPPEEPESGWSAPVWDRPSEGTVPAVVAVNQLLYRRDDLVVSVDHLRVYPNGFTIELAMLCNPRLGRRSASFDTLLAGTGPASPGRRMPRVGVRIADGRSVGRAPRHGDIPKDENGLPTEPVLGMTHAGGGSRGFRYGVWVYPLPPEGPVEIVVALPGREDEEATATVDGAEVRRAAELAVVVWT